MASGLKRDLCESKHTCPNFFKWEKWFGTISKFFALKCSVFSFFSCVNYLNFIIYKRMIMELPCCILLILHKQISQKVIEFWSTFFENFFCIDCNGMHIKQTIRSFFHIYWFVAISLNRAIFIDLYCFKKKETKPNEQKIKTKLEYRLEAFNKMANNTQIDQYNCVKMES